MSKPQVLAEPNPVSNGADSTHTPRPDQNPLLSVIGAFENDPGYDALMEDVYEYRRQLDARENEKAD
jgi:hypothetical protein